MNKETFINYIKNDYLLGKESINELTELVTEFPYCSTAHILLSMNLRKEDHFKYDSELKKTAVYVADRSILRKHIDRIATTDQSTLLPNEDIELADEVKTDTTEIDEIVTESIPAKEDSRLSEVEQAEEKKPDVTNSEIQNEILEEEVKTDESQPETHKELTEQENLQIEGSVEEVYEQEQSPPEEDTLSELRKIVQNRLKQIELEKRKKEQSVLKEDTIQVKKEDSKPAKKKKESRSVTELIDKFIKTEPSITRRQSTFFDPTDAAKDSVTDEENIVSETLAEIYFGQRKFEKAISVYKKLSLKFPEKSSYFAARIEKAVEELKK